MYVLSSSRFIRPKTRICSRTCNLQWVWNDPQIWILYTCNEFIQNIVEKWPIIAVWMLHMNAVNKIINLSENYVIRVFHRVNMYTWTMKIFSCFVYALTYFSWLKFCRVLNSTSVHLQQLKQLLHFLLLCT